MSDRNQYPLKTYKTKLRNGDICGVLKAQNSGVFAVSRVEDFTPAKKPFDDPEKWYIAVFAVNDQGIKYLQSRRYKEMDTVTSEEKEEIKYQWEWMNDNTKDRLPDNVKQWYVRFTLPKAKL